MNKFAFMCLAAGIVLGACSVRGGPAHAGDGPHVQQDRQVVEFSAVELAGAFEADIRIGSPQQVTLEGELDLIQEIETEVEHGQLTVRFPRGRVKGPDVRVIIVTPQLDRLEADGATTLDIDGLRGKAFALEVNGASTARLDGEVKALKAEINGAGRLDSTALNAQSVHLEVNGSGRADVTALADLDVEINGAGRVRYRGGPTVAQAIHGAGRVKPF